MTEEIMKLGEIQSFDHEGGPDWALAPPKLCRELNDNSEKFLEEQMKLEPNIASMQQTLEDMQRAWTKKNLDIEIAIAEGSRMTEDKTERDIKTYSTSSANRRRFMMYMLRAAYEGEPVTYKELIKLLSISRNGLDTMIAECIDAGWIILTNDEATNKKTYLAADVLIKAYENYTKWLALQWNETGARQISTSIQELKRMIDHAHC